jgi:hypothetical protein
MKYVIILTLLLIGNVSLFAQAYHGGGDEKIFLGYANVGGKSGVEAQYDEGINDLLSYGFCATVLAGINNGNKNDDNAYTFNALNGYNIGAFLRFHFLEALKLNRKTDPYLGIDVSFKSLGLHAGVKYNFSEVVGMYVQIQQGFSNSFWNNNNGRINYFGKEFGLGVGMTIDL